MGEGELGEEAVGESQKWAMERYWKRSVEAIDARPRKEIVQLLAATWRAHSTSGVGPNPGAFEIEEDDEKVTFRMNPCGSGQRLWRNRRYEGENGYAVMEEEHDWAYNRKGFPIYCTHCTFMNEMLPIQWIGYPVYPEPSAGRLRPRSVHLVLVQGPRRHPGRALGAVRARA